MIHGMIGKIDQGLVGHLVHEIEPPDFRREIILCARQGQALELPVIFQQTGGGMPQQTDKVIGNRFGPGAPMGV